MLQLQPSWKYEKLAFTPVIRFRNKVKWIGFKRFMTHTEAIFYANQALQQEGK